MKRVALHGGRLSGSRQRGASVVSFVDSELPPVETLAAALEDFVVRSDYSAERVSWQLFEQYSARASARALAGALDAALQRWRP